MALAQPDISPLACILVSAFGFTLLWKSVEKLSQKRLFFFALLWFAATQSAHLSWFASDRYVGFYIYLFLALFVLFEGVVFGLFTLAIYPLQKLSYLKIFALASLWTLFEWSRLYYFSGFSWDPLGLALTATSYGRMGASIFGVFGLTFLVMLFNLLALKLFVEKSSFTNRRVGLFTFCAISPYLLGGSLLLFHQIQMQIQIQTQSTPTLSVLLVQPALYPEQKVQYPGILSKPLTPWELWEHVFLLLKKYENKKIDLIVLPEGAVPYGTDHPIFLLEDAHHFFRYHFPTYAKDWRGEDRVGNAFFAQALAQHFQAEVVIGLEDREGADCYNAAFFFHPEGKRRERYEKRVLVPLGEYIPFSFCKKFLQRYGIHDSCTPGKEAKVFKGKKSNFGISICYEETYGYLMRESRLEGADLLINLTNDVWYPQSRLPVVHFLHGRLRSVEQGVPVVRACNTGLTCGVDSFGRTVAELGYEKKDKSAPTDALYFQLPLYHYPTLYTYWGDRGIVSFASLFLLLFSLQKVIKRRKT